MSEHFYPPDHDMPEDDQATKALAACIVLLSGIKRYVTFPDERWERHYDTVLSEAVIALDGICGADIKSEGKP